MAQLKPFSGIRYNPEKIDDFSRVITPPFDVISQEQRDAFHRVHPNNMIRLILAKKAENDTTCDIHHSGAAGCYRNWLDEAILVRDPNPSFYLTSTEFTFENQTFTRYGLITLVKLEPFEKGIVLPHERTFSRVKSDRLELMKRCHANFSPIYALFSDPGNVFNTLKNSVDLNRSEVDFIDTAGHRNRLWRIEAASVHDQVVSALKDSKIFIADGHHRYETALNYRQWVSQCQPDFSPDHPANFVMMSLSSMEDPGVVILPAHRLIKGIGPDTMEAFIKKAGNFFEIETFPCQADRRKADISQFVSSAKMNGNRSALKQVIGVSMKGSETLHLLKARPGIMEKLFSDEMPDALINLDVTVLTRLIFMDLLGFDQERLDNDQLIDYTSIAEDAAEAVYNGRCDMSFILNPTRMEQVREIAEKGLIMPRKSTYFYPKVGAGLVLNDLTRG